MNSNSSLLHEISWTDVKELDKKSTVILLPVGSTEQHGPHNPLGTDFMIAEYIAKEAASLSKKSYCLPTLPVGVASHHRNFPGTLFSSVLPIPQLVVHPWNNR